MLQRVYIPSALSSVQVLGSIIVSSSFMGMMPLRPVTRLLCFFPWLLGFLGGWCNMPCNGNIVCLANMTARQ